ncbi:hypothetical protein MBLNU459_g4645t2 [Dothideomycetes sp. NU459]
MSQSPRAADVEGSAALTSAAAEPHPSSDEHEQQEMSRGGPDDHGDHGLAYDFEVKEQDRWLPIANASEKCQQEKRKTVNGEDILFAMTSLGFENYSEALKIYLARYRETLVARGEHQRPSAPSGNNPANTATTSPPYESAGHSALGGAVEPAEGATDFAYSVGHNPGGDY